MVYVSRRKKEFEDSGSDEETFDWIIYYYEEEKVEQLKFSDKKEALHEYKELKGKEAKILYHSKDVK